VQFFEKKRRKTYFFGKADEEVCWETWTLDVTLATPRTETGTPIYISLEIPRNPPILFSTPIVLYQRKTNMRTVDVIKVRRAMTKSLQKAAFKIVNIVNQYKDHIPPITTTDQNPFPYLILVNPKPNADTWGPRMGIF
jgi:hypothetical protein